MDISPVDRFRDHPDLREAAPGTRTSWQLCTAEGVVFLTSRHRLESEARTGIRASSKNLGKPEAIPRKDHPRDPQLVSALKPLQDRRDVNSLRQTALQATDMGLHRQSRPDGINQLGTTLHIAHRSAPRQPWMKILAAMAALRILRLVDGSASPMRIGRVAGLPYGLRHS
jgi:hypothetical protein